MNMTGVSVQFTCGLTLALVCTLLFSNDCSLPLFGYPTGISNSTKLNFFPPLLFPPDFAVFSMAIAFSQLTRLKEFFTVYL